MSTLSAGVELQEVSSIKSHSRLIEAQTPVGVCNIIEPWLFLEFARLDLRLSNSIKLPDCFESLST
eukprot:1265263-Amphidinium_carterae.1